MRYADGEESPFDTDNRAWRRLLALAEEHFSHLIWQRDGDGRPVFITLADLASGDMISLAVMDSVEMRQPHVLLAVHTDGRLTAHGPADGSATAASYAPHLAMTDATTAATIAIGLYDPAQPTLPDTAWRELPDALENVQSHVPLDTPTLAVALLGYTDRRLAVVGPFSTMADAAAWRPTGTGDRTVDQLVVAVHRISPDSGIAE